ncbi:DUF3426 domain-containing protein [Gilvimarinus sp. SDUM040013]|uniref:DUF3426 domain-containing protein n=1 Tax=Gilvimarinus gilvus TaxID=3058038 RepID=A0ABU4RSI4_9GAMM|nr:DUF3426 domain-containing protein [Gilvimarinus sp. SDUM040013]MDO3388315.1 DUF3426 domain-containing protein [Gilvimarinus sp. SDUM040013]MDX6847865.1 DUF3426 domain-containing protein [Gilvimarinus sp. SDUM040013]
MAEMVTRCPECSTSFRITHAQIQKARGAVRCGSCLHIFNAQKHLIEGKPVTKKARAPQAAAAQSKTATSAPQQENLDIGSPTPSEHQTAKLDTQTSDQASPGGGLKFDQSQIDRESEISDDQLISDNMHKGAEEDSELFFIEEQRAGHSLFERKLDKHNEEFIDETDESWAENLLDDDPQADASPNDEPLKSTFENPLSIVGNDEIDAPTNEEHNSPYSQEVITTPVKHEQRKHSLKRKSAAADSNDADTDYATKRSAPANSEQPQATRAAKNPPQPKFHLTNEDENEEYSEKLTAFDPNRSAMLFNIDPEPVEMAGVSTRQWKKRLAWGGASVLAVLVLIIQIAWLQFDRFSRAEPYRQYYSQACNLLGCTVPALSDNKRIRTFNLVVRNHPEQAEALAVDAIVLNGAPFEQTYPDLELTFTDINNKPVASRVFTPQEYLKGELAGSKIMPTNQPIHLSLELADPGESAVNYRLDIR